MNTSLNMSTCFDQIRLFRDKEIAWGSFNDYDNIDWFVALIEHVHVWLFEL